MRLDKFLKVSRLIKRRTVAKEICDAQRVSINGHTAKAGSEVSVGDEIAFKLGERLIHIRVDEIKEVVKANEASELYSILE